jgi:antitoxin ParD1/3/4
MLTTIDSDDTLDGMSGTTMSFALPEALRAYIDERVRSGEFGNTSEYLRELIRRDQQFLAARRLRELIADGLESGDGRPATDAVIDEIRDRAFAAEL